jgi:HlyD family secretion protein
MKKIMLLIIAASASMTSCNSTENNYDASGAFESVETIVSTEASGTIMQFNIEEGQTLNAGTKIGFIDTVQLYLKKKQIEAQIAATQSQQPDIPLQVASLQAQLSNAETNQNRIDNLVKADAATQKDLDDANMQVDVLKKQIAAQQSSLSISSTTISRNITPLQTQIAQMNDQLAKSYIVNPVHGTVLTKYAEAFEMASPGKALYKIAPIDTLILRAYVTESQLSQIKLGQQVKVRVDSGEKNYKQYPGTIYWISSESEFTPKTIQTKDERADLVYAIKIRVPNDGYLKIGMYGEVKF